MHTIAIASGISVVATEKAGSVSMIGARQAYPLFATPCEALLLGKRRRARSSAA